MPFLFIFLVPFLSFGFVEPNFLRCDAKRDFSISTSRAIKKNPKGIHRIPLSDVIVLKVANKKGTIAKLYPRMGLDSILIQKKSYRIESDERTFWRLLYRNGESQLYCELLND